MNTRPLSDEEIGQLAESDEGRRQLAEGYTLRPEVWDALTALIAEQKTHELKTTMEESGVTYNVTMHVEKTGPAILNIQSQIDKTLNIAMIDTDRDQKPETLKITKTVNGKPETHETPIAQFASGDASQFLLAWSLAWGSLAEQERSAVVPPSEGS
jgi:hypothetical protein